MTLTAANDGAVEYELDPTVRRFDGGRVLAGGLPSRLIRLTAAGSKALDEALARRSLGDAESALVARLERLGLLHPVPDDAAVAGPGPTTIIPVRDGGESLLSLVRSLLPGGEVLVVDDGSTDGAPERAHALGARLLPNHRTPGPAGARNTGLYATETELVAFIDADCVASADWHRGLGALLVADPTLALVAPRIRAAPARGRLARYEERCSPLDLGPAPSLLGRGRRVAYLPSAAFVARRADLLDVGGFDERLRFGEDVDLTLRVRAEGRRIRYVPRREVMHHSRADLRGMARQRVGYGSSAPELAERHYDAVASVRLDRHSLSVLGAGLVAGPAGAGVALFVSVTSTASQGATPRTRLALAQISLRGHASAATHLSRALTREWLPLTLAAAALGRRCRAVAGAALLIDLLVSSRREGGEPPEPVTFAALRILDNASYSAGLWMGVARRRSLQAVRPCFETRPGAGAGPSRESRTS